MRSVVIVLAVALASTLAVVVRADEDASERAPDRAATRAPDLVAPDPELARHLARFDDEAEPGRELKRAFVSVVAYLLAGDVERALPYFHPDLRFHVGAGDFEPVPPERLAEQLREQRDEAARLPVAEVLDLASVRAYSRARAAEVDAAKEGWTEVEPAQVTKHMSDGDWLVIAKVKRPEFGRETFYVFRKDGERYKVVLAE